MDAVPYPQTTYTPEMLAYYRHRYAERCKDPAYKEKVRQYARDARARKKALNGTARDRPGPLGTAGGRPGPPGTTSP